MKAQSMRRIPVWSLLFWIAFSIHATTFVLRLEVFWPTPALFDFTSFYMAGWAVRLHLSPYRWPEETLLALAEATQTPPPIPLLNSFPLWAWFMQPLSWLNFPAAAWLWLAIQLFMLIWCAIALARLAGVATRKGSVAVFVLLMTFGPTALTLALGQSALIALMAALLLAEQLRAVHAFRLGLALLAWLAALATKLFPLFWPVVFLLQRKFLLFATTAVALVFFAAGHFLVIPTLTAEYFFLFLPGRVDEFSTLPGRDDQSLLATIQRLFAGEAPLLSFAAAGVTLAWLGWLVLRLTIRGARLQEYTAPFFAWVLFCLLPFPHTERYNHVLLTPAMAWLWGNGEHARRFALAGYMLAAVARLTRLWEQLPIPLPAVMSVAGAAAAIALIVGIAEAVNRADLERNASSFRSDSHRLIERV
jgi:hypothetical protein